MHYSHFHRTFSQDYHYRIIHCMQKILLSVFAVLTYYCGTAQTATFDWATSTGSTSNSDLVYDLEVDTNGNAITTGYFDGTVDFDPGPGTTNLTAVGNRDAYVLKQDANDNLLWVAQFGGPSYEHGDGLTTDNAGNVYITGYFQDTTDFDPGPGVFTMIPIGSVDAFIVKLDPNGVFVWAKQVGGSSVDYGRDIVVDQTGNLYIAGQYGSFPDMDPGPGTATLNWTGGSDIFILKLDNNGDYVWAHGIGSIMNDGGHDIAVDNAGGVYITGDFSMTADFNPGAGTYNMTSIGGEDIFIAKFTDAGVFSWAKQIGSTANDSGFDIAVDGSGNVYSVGYFQDAADFNTDAGSNVFTPVGGSDGYLHKLNSSGVYQWAFQIGGPGDDRALGVATDILGNVYTTGEFRNIIDFDPGPGIANMDAGFGSDAFISSLSPSGNYNWAAQIGANSSNIGWSIQVLKDCCLYSTGQFRVNSDFDPGPGVFNMTTNSNSIDVYVHRWFICNATYATITPTVCDSFVSPSTNYTWNTSGTYTDTIMNAQGCDSIITVNLTVNYTTSSTQNVMACDSMVSPSGNYTWLTSGTYMDTIPNTSGCDSLMTINLTVNYTDTATLNDTMCSSYTSPSGNYVWTAPGTYMDTILTTGGCDSILTINLVSLNSTATIDTMTCESYTSPSGMNTWNTSGTYMDTIPNVAGCDSILTINLTILNMANTINISECSSYTSPSGNYTWTTAGTYMDTIPNTAGCDSILTINLTINNSFATWNISACDSFMSPSGNYVWMTSGTYMDTITNNAFCDSILTINLTINTVDIGVTQTNITLTADAAGADYQWLDCDNSFAVLPGETNPSFTASADGNYAVEVTENGCVDTSSCYTITGVGIAGFSAASTPSVYPNPATGHVTIATDWTISKIEFISMTGQSYFPPYKDSNGQFQLDLTGLRRGIYVVKIYGEEGLHTHRLVID